jgi:Putative transposase of IS4/5 family (DUF4096)
MSRFSGVRAMVLADEQWAALKPALDAVRPGTGRPLADERLTLDGMVWRLRNGARWRAVPARVRPVVAPGAAPHPPVRGGRVGAAVRAPARRGAAGRGRGRPGRDGGAGAPQGGGRAQKGGTGRERDRREALGRSRGGFGTEACAACDAAGRPLAFALLPG